MITVLGGRSYVDDRVSLAGMGDFGFSIGGALSSVGHALGTVASDVGKVAVAPLVIPAELGLQAVSGAFHEAAPLAQSAAQIVGSNVRSASSLLAALKPQQFIPGVGPTGATVPPVPSAGPDWPLILLGVGGAGLLLVLLLRKPKRAEAPSGT